MASLILYSLAIMLGTLAARHANTNLVAAITNIFAAIIPVAFVLSEFGKKSGNNQRLGLVAAVATGVAIAFFSLALNKSYSLDKVALVVPIVFGGSIFLTAILSYVFFKERITPYQGTGLVLLAVGLMFVGYAKVTGK